MSKFSAINLSDDEVDLEEHTRELQIEESLKFFKTLLHLQKDKDYVKAFDVYQKLFKIDVISDFSPSTSAVSNLRYLCYRNRGFLKFDKLLDDHKARADSTLSEDEEFLDELYDDLMSCIEDLITALMFGDGDSSLVELIYQLFDYFGNDRLTRFILEYELMKNDISTGNESNLLVLRRNKLSTTFNKFLHRYQDLLVKLNDYDATLSSDNTFINRNKIHIDNFNKIDTATTRDLSFLEPLRKEILISQNNNLRVPRKVELDLSKYQINDLKFSIVVKEVQLLLPKSKSRSKRFFDYYYNTDEPIEIVRIKLREDQEDDASEDVVMNDDEPKVTTEKDENEVENGDGQPVDTITLERKDSDSSEAKEQKQEDKEKERIRSSRRLNLSQTVEEPPKISEIDFSYQEKFFSSLNGYLKLLEDQKKGDFKIDAIVPQIKTQSFETEDTHLNDFLNILEEWNKKSSELLLTNVENNKKNISIMEILNANSFDEIVPTESKSIESYDLSEFIDSLNANALHFYQLRIEILDFISRENDGESLIIDYKIDTTSLQHLKQFLDCSDILLYNKIKDSLGDIKSVHISVVLLEMLVDSYIDTYQELEANKNLERHKIASAELLSQKKRLTIRIERWRTLLQDLFYTHNDTKSRFYLRFEWCDLIYLQHQDNLTSINKENIKTRLSAFLLHDSLESVDINFLNYHHIQRLNKRNVNVQLSKLNILTTFANIFKEDLGLDSSDKIDLLESILFPDVLASKSKEQADMEEFVRTSDLELKLKLFQVLLDHFRKTSNVFKYQSCIEHLISLLYSSLTSTSYQGQTSFMRHQELIRIYAFLGEFFQHYVSMISENNWTLTDTETKTEAFIKILDFFRVAYIFCVHEDIAFQCTLKISIKDKSVRSHRKLKDIVTSVFTLVFVYYQSMMDLKQPVQINDLIDLLHDQLGIRRYCDAAGGLFLKLMEDTLVQLGWAESEKDILQIISCRYKLHISVDGFVPANHETVGIPFDKQNALEIAKYVLPICFKKRNPIVNSIKSDIKVLLDSIYEAIGDPDETNESVARCSALLEEFLDNTPLSVKVMRDFFYGLGSIDLTSTRLDIQQVIDNGLYYLQGVNALNLFKVRKRSMQSRISELDFVIKMLKQDLYCGSNRIESWMLLGQTYGFLVEDDLIWTSDKLTNEDKKESTAILQKKSLLCYLMAINCYTSIPDKTKITEVSAMLWSSFAKLFYNASMEPMSKLCFNVNSIPTYFKKRTKIFEKSYSNTISQKTILALLISSFKMAAKLDDKDWVNFYYIAKLEHKLESPTKKIFENLIKSCVLAKSHGSHSDPIIEPHYLLCSLVYKLNIMDQLSIGDAIEHLMADPMLKIDKDDDMGKDKKSLAYLIINCLKQIISFDKKNWHHKPHYRIAKIQMETFHDIESAKLEMLTLINLKPTVKNLVTIWKPEYERPGKHFVYNLQYVMFSIDILYEEGDLTSLLALGRKLRRFGASIIQILKAWGQATKKICDLSRRYAGIEYNYSEKCISTILYGEFMIKAKEFNNYLNEKHSKFDNEKHQTLLYLFTELGEIKRMSNGFSQTAYIDDTFYCVYLKLYFIYRQEIDQSTLQVNVEDAVKTKLAKRDIAEVIKSLKLPKLPEKLPQYDMPPETAPIGLSQESKFDSVNSVNGINSVEAPRSGDLSKTEAIDVSLSVEEAERKPTVAAAEINQEEMKTPENKKRVISLDDTPASQKKLKLDDSLKDNLVVTIDDDDDDDTNGDLFVTPKKSFDEVDDVDTKISLESTKEA